MTTASPAPVLIHVEPRSRPNTPDHVADANIQPKHVTFNEGIIDSSVLVTMPAGSPEGAALDLDSDSMFPLSVASIQKLFATETTPADVQSTVSTWGGVNGLMETLKTSPAGLDLSEIGSQSASTEERTRAYGRNVLPKPIPKSFLDFVKEAGSDPIMLLLLVAGAISIGLGLATEPESGWHEGISIIFAVCAVVSVAALNNWSATRTARTSERHGLCVC